MSNIYNIYNMSKKDNNIKLNHQINPFFPIMNNFIDIMENMFDEPFVEIHVVDLNQSPDLFKKMSYSIEQNGPIIEIIDDDEDQNKTSEKWIIQENNKYKI